MHMKYNIFLQSVQITSSYGNLREKLKTRSFNRSMKTHFETLKIKSTAFSDIKLIGVRDSVGNEYRGIPTKLFRAEIRPNFIKF